LSSHTRRRIDPCCDSQCKFLRKRLQTPWRKHVPSSTQSVARFPSCDRDSHQFHRSCRLSAQSGSFLHTFHELLESHNRIQNLYCAREVKGESKALEQDSSEATPELG